MDKGKKNHLQIKLKENSGFLYFLPSLILIIIFAIVPLIMTLYFSFTKYNVLEAPKFVGFVNYMDMLKDPFLKPAIRNTIIYTIITVPIQTLISLLCANVFAMRFNNRFGKILKSIFFVPVISSMILVGIIWRFILSTNDGILNLILEFLGLNTMNWLGDYNLALISVSMVAVWKNIGYFLVIYYAGFMDIPKSLFESANIDGANMWQKFRYISLPYLKPITYLVVTLGTIWSFQVFDLVYAMTGGGPGTATITMVLSIYEAGFKHYRLGYASAISSFLFIIILIISVLQKKIFDRR